MAEKIYQDNIVLHKNAMDEFLTEIRNYPLIDIEEVLDSDTDPMHTAYGDNQDSSKDVKVWDTYTDGHRAWRIIYGNPDNESGNYAHLSNQQRAQLRDLEENLRIIEEKAAIYSRYQGSINDYERSIQNIRDEYATILDNIQTVYERKYIALENYIKDSHYNGKANPLDPNDTGAFPKQFAEATEKYRLQCCITAPKVDRYLRARLEGEEIDGVTEKANAFHYFSVLNTTNLKYSANDGPVYRPVNGTQITVILLKSNFEFTSLYNSLLNVIDPEYIGMDATHPDYVTWNTIWRPNAEKAMALLQDYNDYFNDAENTLNNTTVLLKVKNYFQGINDTITERAKAINAINANHNLDEETEQEIEDRYSLNNSAIYKSSIVQAIKELQSYALEKGTEKIGADKLIKGYKYISAGDEVNYIRNFKYKRELPVVNGSQWSEWIPLATDQNFGTFRTFINNRQWETYVKGFGESSLHDLKLINDSTSTSGGNILIRANTGNVNIKTNGTNKKIYLDSATQITNNGATNTTNGGTMLTVNGNIEDKGALTVLGASNLNGALTVGKTTATVATTLNGTLTVTGAATVNGAITGKSSLTITGATTLNSTLHTVGNTTLDGTLTVGKTTAKKATVLHGSLTVDDAATFSGAIQANSTLTVAGATSINNTLSVTKATTIGSATSPVDFTVNGFNLKTFVAGPDTSDTKKRFWRGDKTWSNQLDGPFIVTGGSTAKFDSYNNPHITIGAKTNKHLEIDSTQIIAKTSETQPANLKVNGATFERTSGGQTYIKADRVYSAVYNDYAEFRLTIDLEPGRCVIDKDDGTLECSSMRLQPGAQVISDTYGHSMGETEKCKTPLAVAGRVLVYPYQSIDNYHAGMAVCTAPNGTVDIMTREEIKNYPDCIVGIVSEIPKYEVWGNDDIKVNGRIWIKIK